MITVTDLRKKSYAFDHDPEAAFLDSDKKSLRTTGQNSRQYTMLTGFLAQETKEIALSAIRERTYAPSVVFAIETKLKSDSMSAVELGENHLSIRALSVSKRKMIIPVRTRTTLIQEKDSFKKLCKQDPSSHALKKLNDEFEASLLIKNLWKEAVKEKKQGLPLQATVSRMEEQLSERNISQEQACREYPSYLVSSIPFDYFNADGISDAARGNIIHRSLQERAEKIQDVLLKPSYAIFEEFCKTVPSLCLLPSPSDRTHLIKWENTKMPLDMARVVTGLSGTKQKEAQDQLENIFSLAEFGLRHAFCEKDIGLFLDYSLTPEMIQKARGPLCPSFLPWKIYTETHSKLGF